MQVANTKNKCFIVRSNEIDSRLDPEYYNPKFNDFFTLLEKGKYKSVFLSEIATDIFQGVGKNETNEPNYILLKVKNILLNNKIDYSNTEFIKDAPKSKLLKKGDILSPFIGEAVRICKFSIFNKENNKYMADNNTGIIRINPEKANNEYVAVILNSRIGKIQIDKLIGGGGVPFLGAGNAKKFKIPLPPLEIQNKIVEIMQLAYEKKSDKEQKSENILNSIDDYILGELGIKITNLKNKNCFGINSKEVEGKRLDPKGHLDIPQTIIKAISKSKYKTKMLSELVETNIAGEWGEDPISFENNKDYSLIKVLRNTNFDNQGNLNFDDVAERLIENKKLEKVELKTGDILIEKSGGSPIQPVGRVALIENLKEKFTFSNFLQCFRVKKNCLPEYLFCFLKALYGLNYMEYIQNQTTGIKNLIMEEYLSIPIPLPSIATQKQLANEFKNRLKKANELKTEAKQEVEKAKQGVEKIILGK